MSLTITTAMIEDLLDGDSRPTDTGIVLGCGGWSVAVHSDGLPSGRTAFSADDVLGVLGDGAEIDDSDSAEIIELMTVPPNGGSYQILAEDGGDVPPADEASWQVVTHRRSEWDEDIPDWESAYWFALDDASKVIDDDETKRRGDQESLWRTSGGRWLLRRRSWWTQGPAEFWVEISANDAVNFAYGLEDERLLCENLPFVIQAARHARAIVDLFIPPSRQEVASGDGHVARDAAAEIFNATPVVARLIRDHVAPALRDNRIGAAMAVIATLGRDQKAAAEWLDVSEATLSGLLR